MLCLTGATACCCWPLQFGGRCELYILIYVKPPILSSLAMVASSQRSKSSIFRNNLLVFFFVVFFLPRLLPAFVYQSAKRRCFWWSFITFIWICSVHCPIFFVQPLSCNGARLHSSVSTCPFPWVGTAIDCTPVFIRRWWWGYALPPSSSCIVLLVGAAIKITLLYSLLLPFRSRKWYRQWHRANSLCLHICLYLPVCWSWSMKQKKTGNYFWFLPALVSRFDQESLKVVEKQNTHTHSEWRGSFRFLLFFTEKLASVCIIFILHRPLCEAPPRFSLPLDWTLCTNRFHVNVASAYKYRRW